MRASWGWWDRWVRWHCPPDTGFEIESWRSEVEYATSRSRTLPCTILSHNEWTERNICLFETWIPEWGSNPRVLAWQAFGVTTTPEPTRRRPRGDSGIQAFASHVRVRPPPPLIQFEDFFREMILFVIYMTLITAQSLWPVITLFIYLREWKVVLFLNRRNGSLIYFSLQRTFSNVLFVNYSKLLNCSAGKNIISIS